MGLYRTYLPAKAVETVLEERLLDYGRNVYSTPYYNGREHGFFFYGPNIGTYVYVCEARNSDHLMVTTSKNMGWDEVTEEEYRAAKYFDYEDREGVATLVIAELGIREED